MLIDFWATDCPPCRAELKQTIAKLAEDTALRDRGLRVWAINVLDGAGTAQRFLGEDYHGLNAMVDNEQRAASQYPTNGIPTTYLIGRDGSVRRAFLGFGPDTDEQLRAAIDAALK